MIFQTVVNETPCCCHVLVYSDGLTMKITGSGFGDCEPEEPPEFEYQILDTYGKPNPQLESELTDDDDERLEREYLAQLDDIRSNP